MNERIDLAYQQKFHKALVRRKIYGGAVEDQLPHLLSTKGPLYAE